MEERPESNTDLKTTDVFTAVNNYLLLFLCASCLLASGYLQQMLMIMGLYSLGISVSALATHFDMSRIAVLKHVQALEAAELLLSKKEGRTRHLYFNPVPIQLIHDRWTTKYSEFWAGRMVDIQARVERRANSEEPKIT